MVVHFFEIYSSLPATLNTLQLTRPLTLKLAGLIQRCMFALARGRYKCLEGWDAL